MKSVTATSPSALTNVVSALAALLCGVLPALRASIVPAPAAEQWRVPPRNISLPLERIAEAHDLEATLLHPPHFVGRLEAPDESLDPRRHARRSAPASALP